MTDHLVKMVRKLPRLIEVRQCQAADVCEQGLMVILHGWLGTERLSPYHYSQDFPDTLWLWYSHLKAEWHVAAYSLWRKNCTPLNTLLGPCMIVQLLMISDRVQLFLSPPPFNVWQKKCTNKGVFLSTNTVMAILPQTTSSYIDGWCLPRINEQNALYVTLTCT